MNRAERPHLGIDPKLTALQFNECINRQDICGLSSLMTDDHTFIDRKGEVVAGKEAMTKGWIDFFGSFPEYRNTFLRVESHGDLVVLYGYATWEKGAAPDHAIWKATIENDLVAEWRIYEEGAFRGVSGVPGANHFSPAERQGILDRLIAALEEDQAVAGALIVGSAAEGFDDVYSDIDLCAVVAHPEDVYPTSQAWGSRLEQLLPVFFSGDLKRGPNSYLWVVLLENFLEVNLTFQHLDDLRARRGRWKVAFDRTGKIEGIQQASATDRPRTDLQEAYYERVRWVWHYVMHATVAAQRGQMWRALHELEQVRTKALELRGLRDGLETKRLRQVDQMAPAFLSGMEQTLVARLERPEIMRALTTATDHFFREARQVDEMLGLDLAQRFEVKTQEYLELFR